MSGGGGVSGGGSGRFQGQRVQTSSQSGAGPLDMRPFLRVTALLSGGIECFNAVAQASRSLLEPRTVAPGQTPASTGLPEMQRPHLPLEIMHLRFQARRGRLAGTDLATAANRAAFGQSQNRS